MLFQNMQVYLLLTQILKKAHKFYCREFIMYNINMFGQWRTKQGNMGIVRQRNLFLHNIFSL